MFLRLPAAGWRGMAEDHGRWKQKYQVFFAKHIDNKTWQCYDSNTK